MKLIKWEELPVEMQTDAVRVYYDLLAKRKNTLIFKRIFDVVCSLTLLVILAPVFLIVAIAIKLDSPGPVFYRQVRITQYGKPFRIHKFRTMVNHADQKGGALTVAQDVRVTRVGKWIRRCRFDEISQLIDVLCGTMTFVGTRPEVARYVEQYAPVMMATLLLPAGVTSEASIIYKDEGALLAGAEDVDEAYVNKLLPGKMYYNLKSLERISFWGDIGTMFKTVFAVLGKNYEGDLAGEVEFADSLRREELEV